MVNCVELSSDAYLVCLSHALSTEKEEVMGLLMGEVRFSPEYECHIFVSQNVIMYIYHYSVDGEQGGSY